MKKIVFLLLVPLVTSCSNDGYVRCKSVSTSSGMSWENYESSETYRVGQYAYDYYFYLSIYDKDMKHHTDKNLDFFKSTKYLVGSSTIYAFFDSSETGKFPKSLSILFKDTNKNAYGSVNFNYKKTVGTYIKETKEVYYSKEKSSIKVIDGSFTKKKGDKSSSLDNKTIVHLKDVSYDSYQGFDISSGDVDGNYTVLFDYNEDVSYYTIGSETIQYTTYK